MLDAVFIHHSITALSVIATSLSVGLSQGIVSASACQAINIQPQAKDSITNTAILSTALIETASITGVFMSVLLFLEPAPAHAVYAHLAKIGIGLAICLSGAAVAFISAFPAAAACMSIARQPFAADWIFRFTLMILAIMQTPLIFALIISLFIKTQAAVTTTLPDALRLIGAGFAIGVGTLGPVYGMGLITRAAARGVGINRHAANRILSFTFISQTIIETPIIFSSVIAFLLLFYKSAGDSLHTGIAMLAAGFAIGLGTIGVGLNAGRVARNAVAQITHVPEQYAHILKTSIFAQGFIDTNAIYALIVASALVLFL